VSGTSGNLDGTEESSAPRPGRAARRRARRRPPPLPQRGGLDAVRWQVPRGTVPGRGALESLRARFPALAAPEATELSARFAAGEIVDADGRAWVAADAVRPGDELWFHRELRPESVPAVELPVLHRDEHLLVIDKPHDVATMPRGAHVLASALVRLRRATGLVGLVPLHRLDRRTAGVLAFGIRPEERSAYQQLFARQEVDKEYRALVVPEPASSLPRNPGERAVLRDRLVKSAGQLTTRVLPGEPNAETALEVLAVGSGGVLHLRLHPRTGRTHQLRAQLAARGAPILGEDLYPRPVPAAGPPLQLLARRLGFLDPVTGQRREFTSGQELTAESRTLGP
jgi:tRNA pseudouridine32 synthase / 23S rRNA pseudouridine746 synthase